MTKNDIGSAPINEKEKQLFYFRTNIGSKKSTDDMNDSLNFLLIKNLKNKNKSLFTVKIKLMEWFCPQKAQVI